MRLVEDPPDWLLDDDPSRDETRDETIDGALARRAPVKVVPVKAAEDRPVTPTTEPFTRAKSLVGAIMSRADEGFVSHTLGGVELYRLRRGGVAILTGAPGTGKTSMSLGIALEHTRERGPVVILSLEMDGDELGARAIGMQCDASWEDVLCGRVKQEFMERALDLPRLVLLDGENATLYKLEQAVAAMAGEYPCQPILVIVDYLQIVPGDEREVRARVSVVAQAVRRLAKRLRVVVLAISQPSRAAGRALSAGELLGADSMTAMAESAEIERSAYVTLALGSAGEERADGTKLIDLSTGKGRMGGGDRVQPVSFDGRTGRMRVDGPSRQAAEVKAERESGKEDRKVQSALLAMITVADRAKEPMTRDELAAQTGTRRTVAGAAVRAGLTSGDLVEVRRKSPRSPSWRLWTRSKATAAGIEIIEEER